MLFKSFNIMHIQNKIVENVYKLRLLSSIFLTQNGLGIMRNVLLNHKVSLLNKFVLETLKHLI